MRSGFLLFLGIALAIYTFLNGIIIWRTGIMLSRVGVLREVALLALAFLCVSYPLGRYLEHRGCFPWSTPLIWVGSFWIAAMVYLFLILVAFVFVDLAVWILGSGKPWAAHWFEWRPQIWGLVVVAVAALIACGHWNALHPQIIRLDWTFSKLLPQTPSFKIVAVSDMHVGTLIGRKRVESIVSQINALKPDLILIGGDTIDSDLDAVVRGDIGPAFRALRATHGVYGVTGNHEYIGGAQPCVDYLEAQGIHILRDKAVLIADTFYLVGREDISSRRMDHKGRAPLSEILAPLDRSRPVFILDHQPVDLDEAERLNADAQFSGHTHDGQFWPFGLIPASLFKLSHGFRQFGSLHAYVTSGVGTWGPMVRIGNSPEIVEITLRPAPR